MRDQRLEPLAAVTGQPAPTTLIPLDRADEALAAVRDRRIAGRAVLRVRDG